MEALAIAGIAVAAAVAVAVAVYQVRAGWMRPNPQFRSLQRTDPDPDTLAVVIDNPGGAAARCCALAQIGRDYYILRRGIAPGVQGFAATMTRLGENLAPEPSELPIVLLVAADDGHRRWWDAVTHRRIWGGIDPWLAKKSSELGLDIPIEVQAGT